MAVKQRSKGTYEIRIDLGWDANGTRIRKAMTVRGSKKEAEAKERELLGARDGGMFVEPSKLTVGQFLDRWLRTYVETAVAPGTAIRYRQIVEQHLVPRFGTVKLSRLQPTDILDAIEHWQTAGRMPRRKRPLEPGEVMSPTGLSPLTVLKHYRVLHDALAQAVFWGMLPVNPADRVKPPRAEEHEAAVLDVAQARALIAYLEDDGAGAWRPCGPLIVLAIHTGLRMGELIGLRWSDIDLERRVLTVRQQWDAKAKSFRQVKSHRSRRPLALPQVAVDLLEDVRRQQVRLLTTFPEVWTSSGLVFTDDRGHHLAPEAVRWRHAAYLRAIGLPPVKVHELRHTHASHLIAAGATAKQVQGRLGHASPAFTLRTYGHEFLPEDAEIAERTAQRFARPRAKGA